MARQKKHNFRNFSVNTTRNNGGYVCERFLNQELLATDNFYCSLVHSSENGTSRCTELPYFAVAATPLVTFFCC